jgi:glycosyltransferase involved in cell wall biosynthesis
VKISGARDLAWQLFRHVSDEWSLNVHTNGHNPKSWLVALVCGMAAQIGAEATLTLHSGGVPEYLRTRRELGRLITRMACLMYTRVICVNPEIADVLMSLGIPSDRLQVEPAFLPVHVPEVVVPGKIHNWVGSHAPFLSSAIFFRPEYGFELLVQAMQRLRKSYPNIGCLVMGAGEDHAQAMALVERSGLNDTIYLAGDVEHDLCLALMSRSAAFIRPTYIDGDSISVREAISLGVPVVASDVGQRPEGVVLFKAGDVDGLVEQLTTVLQPRSGGRT